MGNELECHRHIHHYQRMSRYYFGGELFNLKQLLGNVALAHAIQRVSNGKYEAVLPQDLEVNDKRGKAIRDRDIFTLLSCDLALFHFDGTELDSGTVAEFMLAKFADIPTVVLRTDFRKAGDSPQDPWNLMLSDYPPGHDDFDYNDLIPLPQEVRRTDPVHTTELC